MNVFAFENFIKRRLGDIQITLLYQGRIISEKQGKQQGGDMRPVHIGISGDYYFVVS